MKVKDAYNIIKAKNNSDKELVECLEFDGFFAFAFAEKSKINETVGGGYDTVDKKSGQISVFNPTENLELFISAKKIPVPNSM